MDRGAVSQINLLFLWSRGTIGPGPWPPKARPQGLWAHLSEFDGDPHCPLAPPELPWRTT